MLRPAGGAAAQLVNMALHAVAARAGRLADPRMCSLRSVSHLASLWAGDRSSYKYKGRQVRRSVWCTSDLLLGMGLGVGGKGGAAGRRPRRRHAWGALLVLAFEKSILPVLRSTEAVIHRQAAIFQCEGGLGRRYRLLCDSEVLTQFYTLMSFYSRNCLVICP